MGFCVSLNFDCSDESNRAPILAPSPQHGSIPTNQIKILRRDPTAGQKKSPGPTVAGQKSIEERAEEYRLARERIFGKEPEVPRKNSPKGEFAFVPTQVKRSPANSRETSRAGTPRNAASSYTPVHRPSDATPQRPQDGKGVIRQPKGPSEGGGFGAR